MSAGQADARPVPDGALTSAGMTSREHVTALPADPGSPVPVETPAVAPTEAPDAWDRFLDLLDLAPGWVWAAALGGLLLASLLLMPLIRRNARKVGAHAAGKTDNDSNPTKDRRLLLAALAPAAVNWIAVIVGSGRGLIGFGRDTLRLHDGWELLVPLTLDGVGISFAILAFRAVRKHRNPDRCILVAWVAMGASAVINYGHEAGLPGGSHLGGLYLGLLSVFGMGIFHELLGQFEEGADQIKRSRPKFGMRWITYFPNTLCAALAWTNHPPAGEPKATVSNAVAHLESVRAGKRARRVERFTPSPTGWARILPHVRARQLDAVLASRTAEHAEIASRLEADLAARAAEQAETTTRLDVVAAEFGDAELRWAERVAELKSEREAERLRAEAAERAAAEAERRAGALAEQVAALKAERRKPTTGARGRKAPVQPEPDPEHKPGAPVLSDAEAVAVLLSEHPERTYAWTSREVRHLTGAGFGRIPRLLALVAERHLKTTGSDSAEQSA